MKIWQVWDGDYDGDWVVASYDSERVARAHAETYGLDRVEEVEVLSGLAAEAADPVLCAARARHREEEAAKSRLESEHRAAHDQRRRAWEDGARIDQEGRPRLCHCRVFSSNRDWFELPTGLCRYCYGWTPDVFRAARGETELVRAINELDLHNRTDMRRICGLPPTEDAVSPMIEGSE